MSPTPPSRAGRRPEQDGVRAPHSRVQSERHRETGCRADRVPLLELPYSSTSQL